MADCGGGGANCWRLCISYTGGYSDQLLDFDIRSNLDSVIDEKFKRLQCSSQKLNHKSNQASCETPSRLLVRLRSVQQRDTKCTAHVPLLYRSDHDSDKVRPIEIDTEIGLRPRKSAPEVVLDPNSRIKFTTSVDLYKDCGQDNLCQAKLTEHRKKF